jgi:hypothetical protein
VLADWVEKQMPRGHDNKKGKGKGNGNGEGEGEG